MRHQKPNVFTTNGSLMCFAKGRLESVMQEAKVKQEKIYYVGRSPAASPAAGSLERHLNNQETILKMATEDSIGKIIKS